MYKNGTHLLNKGIITSLPFTDRRYQVKNNAQSILVRKHKTFHMYSQLTFNVAVEIVAPTTPLSAIQEYSPAWALVMRSSFVWPPICGMIWLLLPLIVMFGAGLAASTLQSAVAFCVSITMLGVMKNLRTGRTE